MNCCRHMKRDAIEEPQQNQFTSYYDSNCEANLRDPNCQLESASPGKNMSKWKQTKSQILQYTNCVTRAGYLSPLLCLLACVFRWTRELRWLDLELLVGSPIPARSKVKSPTNWVQPVPLFPLFCDFFFSLSFLLALFSASSCLLDTLPCS